ncbi:MAG: protein kinase [Gammaproteobacteria bacterium]|nr:protein kinase [Gammaproteobacteria bacterium]
MSTVYLAEQENLSRLVALKIMSSELLADPSFKKRFTKEGQIVASLSHPNIVTIHDLGEAEGHPFIAMEYVAGFNLQERIQQGMDLSDCFRTVKRIADALQVLHSNNIIHRDVKPMNILFRENKFAVLTDFGIAKSISSATELTKVGATIGTPSYMSPEQVQGHELNGCSDLYSLGAVFYEMLTGRKPYEGSDDFSTALKHITDPIPRLPKETQFLQPIIDSMLAKDPKDRFPDGQALNRAIDETTGEIPRSSTLLGSGFLGKTGSRSKAIPTQNFQSRSMQISTHRRKWPWVLGIGVLLIAGLLSLIWIKQNDTLDERTLWIINQFHRYAADQLSAGRLLEPPGDNAVETYRNILDLAPRDKRAQSALNTLLIRFQQQAIEKRNQGAFDEGLALIDKGLLINPQHADLLEMKEEIEAETKLRLQQQEIALMLRKSDEQFKAQRLTLPRGDNALETYRAILTIDDGNEQALKGIDAILQNLEDQARANHQAGHIEASASLIREGLNINPEHRGLNALRNDIKQQMDAARRKENINYWLAQAQQQLTSDKLISPQGDNAWESFKRVLEMDIHNKSALSGRQQIITQLEKTARAHAQRNELARAQAIIDQGLAMIPREPSLIKLRNELTQATLKQTEQRKVDRLLAKAKYQFQQGKLVRPRDDNAQKNYLEVLSIQADNSTAKDGLRNIAKHFLAEAKKARNLGNLENALRSISQGLEAAPNNAPLLALQNDIAREVKRKRKQNQILASLRVKAVAQMKAADYTQPSGDNAYETYSQILTLAPGDQEAKAGINRLFEYLVTGAKNSINAGNEARGLLYIQQGLKVRPNNPDLRALRDRVQKNRSHRAQQKKLQALLTQAEGHLAADRLDQATELSEQVLAQSPRNAGAQQIKKKIADRYLALARSRFQSGALQGAQAMIKQGLKIAPAHSGLTALRREIDAQRVAQDKSRDIDELLRKAEHQMTNSLLTTPSGNNAHESFRKVLRLDPNNPQAKQGLEQITARYLYLAQKQKRVNDFQKGLALVERGLGVIPKHTKLLAFKREMLREIKQQQAALRKTKQKNQQKQQLIESNLNALLTTAEKQFAAQRLLQPEGDNAYETYLEVLKLDPENPTAVDGLAAIAQRYEKLAKQKLQAGEAEKSLKFVKKGLEFYPQHQGLKTLVDELTTEIEQSQQSEQPQPIELPRQSEQQPIPERPKPEPRRWLRGTF